LFGSIVGVGQSRRESIRVADVLVHGFTPSAKLTLLMPANGCSNVVAFGNGFHSPSSRSESMPGNNACPTMLHKSNRHSFLDFVSHAALEKPLRGGMTPLSTMVSNCRSGAWRVDGDDGHDTNSSIS